MCSYRSPALAAEPVFGHGCCYRPWGVTGALFPGPVSAHNPDLGEWVTHLGFPLSYQGSERREGNPLLAQAWLFCLEV